MIIITIIWILKNDMYDAIDTSDSMIQINDTFCLCVIFYLHIFHFLRTLNTILVNDCLFHRK